MKRVDYYKGPTLRVNVTDKGLVIERPKRIQRKRTKGWKMPPNTVYVGRPSKWRNRFKVGNYFAVRRDGSLYHYKLRTVRATKVKGVTHAVQLFEEYYLGYRFGNIKAQIGELKGKNLACWCPLDQPCHADILLEIANE